jgi:ABC-2 type transport system ATP-binding protein
LIDVVGLTKLYGDKLALDNVSFRVDSGEILGLLGLNGAGKSTTMNIITGYIGASSGTVIIDGHDVFHEPLEAKKMIGYLPEQFVFYNDMRVGEYLDFICDLKKVRKNRQAHIRDLCAKVGISHITGRMVRNLSKGYRQRVGLAQALIGNPKVLILDEPTVGLDPSQVVEIRSLIKEIGKTSTVIISSHILSEIQNICSRVVMLHNGRLVADDSPQNLSRNVGVSSRVTACIEGEPEKIKAALGRIPGLKEVILLEQRGGAHEYAIESADNRDIRAEVFRALAAEDLPLLDTHSSISSLEDIFLYLVEKQNTAPSDEATKGEGQAC